MDREAAAEPRGLSLPACRSRRSTNRIARVLEDVREEVRVGCEGGHSGSKDQGTRSPERLGLAGFTAGSHAVSSQEAGGGEGPWSSSLHLPALGL